MRRSKRQLGLLLGTALSLVMVGACAETGDLFATQSDAAASMVDRALTAARVARQSGDLNSASSKLAYLVSIAPDNAEVLGEYGKVLTEMGQPEEGIAYLNRAIARDPGNWKLYNAVAVAYDEKHDFASSSAAYTKALALAPGNPAILANDARSRMLAGDTAGAQQLLAQANPTDESRVYFSGLESQLAAAEAAKHSDTSIASAAPAPLSAPVTQANSGDMQAKYRVGETLTPAPASPVTVTVDATPRTPAPAANATNTSTATATDTTPTPPAVTASEATPAPVTAPPATVAAAPAMTAAPVVAAPDQKPAAVAASEAAPESTQPSVLPPAPEIASQAGPVNPVPAPPSPPPAIQPASEPAPVAEQAASAPPVAVEVASNVPAPQTEATPAKPIEIKAVSEAPQPAAQTPVATEVASAPVAAPVAQPSKPVVTIVASQNAIAPPPSVPDAPAITPEAPVVPAAAPDAPAPAPVVETPVAAVVTSPAPASSGQANVALAATAQSSADTHYFIRVGTWHSRKHARHVAAKLRPRDVHIARVKYHGRRYYRVWLAAPVQVEEALESVRSLGYRHARIIAKADTPASVRKVAGTAASGQLAFDFMHQH